MPGSMLFAFQRLKKTWMQHSGLVCPPPPPPTPLPPAGLVCFLLKGVMNVNLGRPITEINQGHLVLNFLVD